MEPSKRTARVAGGWYLAMALSGPIGILVVPSQILVPGDPAASAANIVSHELLIRVGLLASVFCQVAYVFLALALERLFRGVDDVVARWMVSLVLVGAPIAIVNELWHVAALELAASGSMSPHQALLAASFLAVRQAGIAVAGIFWGLWLLPFGILVMRSGFVPRVLGVLLLVGGVSYLADSVLALLAPQARAAIEGLLTLPMAVGEFSMIGWLLIKGVRDEGVRA